MDDLGDNQGSLKEHKRIPIYIVEDHHQVIPFIHENIRKKFIPLEDNTLIHLDSHPDMLIPKEMPADHAYDSRQLYETHDIENWIMPNCYTGIFKHLLWVKPPWCNQIKNMRQNIFIGRCKESKTLRLECRENYFIAEGLFKLRSELDHVKDITLESFTLGNSEQLSESDFSNITTLMKNIRRPILDIDLDFFSTQNPFLQLYKEANLYFHLKNVFEFVPPQNDSDKQIIEAQEKRIIQLEELEELFNYLDEYKTLPEVEENKQSLNYLKVGSIVQALTKHYPVNSIDWNLVFSAGCTIDDHELPHHVSTDVELSLMFKSFEHFLNLFTDPPKIITISRSSSDDYTPKDQVDYIQTRVLEILNKRFPCCEPILSYLDPEDDDQSVAFECDNL